MCVFCRCDHRYTLQTSDWDVTEKPKMSLSYFSDSRLRSNREVNSQWKERRETNSTYGRQRQTCKVKAKPTAQAVLWFVFAVSTAWITFLRLCSRPDERASTKTARTAQNPAVKKRKGKKKSRTGERKWDWSQWNICSRSLLVESDPFSQRFVCPRVRNTSQTHKETLRDVCAQREKLISQ